MSKYLVRHWINVDVIAEKVVDETEIDLKTNKWITWFAYRRLNELRTMESIERDMTQWVDELDKNKKKKVFDESVSNALSNANIEDSIKVNKNMLN